SFNVISNTLDGPDVDTLNPRTRQGSLRQLIQNANAIQGPNTAVVPAGTYNLSLAGTGEDAALTGDLDITDALTLKGAGAGSTIIDANTLDRVFHVGVGTTATLSGMTIRNGDAKGADGGGILSRSNLILNNVTLTNNLGRDGGAIHVKDVPAGMSLTDVTMNSNNASRDGGASYSDNVPIVMTRVTASSNTAAGVGGAIYTTDILGLGVSASLTDVTMNSNRALNGEGGGFFGDKVSATMTRVTANNNTTSKSGGAIFLHDSGGSSMALTDLTMSGNTAVNQGGGFFGDKLVGSSTMTRVTVSGNAATAGGGLYFKDGNTNLTLTDVAISGNTAATNGGGVFVDGAGTMTFIRVTVDANTCTSNRGGGIHFKGGSTSSLTNVTVSGNTCSQGGGIDVEGGNVTLTNVTVANNSATTGGGVNRTGGNLTVKNTIIANSPAGGNCAGTIINAGNNLDSANTCGFGLFNSNPLLGALAYNGGFTRTLALAPGSLAIDRGNATGAPTIDQRQVARGYDGNGVPNNPVTGDYDIGAYEFIGTSLPPTITKLSTVISDPYNSTSAPKAIPGAVVEYTLLVSNPGVPMTTDSVVITDVIPPNTSLCVNATCGAGASPVVFVQGTPTSGLTYTFTSLGSTTDDVSFSSIAAPTTFNYTPVPAAATGCDANVAAIRINPKGTFADGTGPGPDPSFQLRIRVCIR
ncbi:MAG: right-handed parallel beta-helix repeat-containing protein, partial [Betaproteobacteria bacterium]|nr:right-handed parallel beta-helix repeat-containing protein [Betaproteobacteria bacterium]